MEKKYIVYNDKIGHYTSKFKSGLVEKQEAIQDLYYLILEKYKQVKHRCENSGLQVDAQIEKVIQQVINNLQDVLSSSKDSLNTLRNIFYNYEETASLSNIIHGTDETDKSIGQPTDRLCKLIKAMNTIEKCQGKEENELFLNRNKDIKDLMDKIDNEKKILNRKNADNTFKTLSNNAVYVFLKEIDNKNNVKNYYLLSELFKAANVTEEIKIVNDESKDVQLKLKALNTVIEKTDKYLTTYKNPSAVDAVKKYFAYISKTNKKGIDNLQQLFDKAGVLKKINSIYDNTVDTELKKTNLIQAMSTTKLYLDSFNLLEAMEYLIKIKEKEDMKQLFEKAGVFDEVKFIYENNTLNDIEEKKTKVDSLNKALNTAKQYLDSGNISNEKKDKLQKVWKDTWSIIAKRDVPTMNCEALLKKANNYNEKKEFTEVFDNLKKHIVKTTTNFKNKQQGEKELIKKRFRSLGEQGLFDKLNENQQISLDELTKGLAAVFTKK